MQLPAILIYTVLLGALVLTAGAAGVNSTCRQDPRARSDFCGAHTADLLHIAIQCTQASACCVAVTNAQCKPCDMLAHTPCASVR